MRQTILILLFLYSTTNAFCQQSKFEPQWAKQMYRTTAYSSNYFLKADKQKNSYVLADYDTIKIDTLSFISNNRSSSILIKFDKDGNIKWFFPMHNNATRVSTNDLVIDENGSSYITGEYFGVLKISQSIILPPNPDPNIPNHYLIKIDNLGNPVWARGFQNGGIASLFLVGKNEVGLKRNESSSNYQIGDTLVNNFNSFGVAIFDANGNIKAKKIIPFWGINSKPWTFISDLNGNIYSLMMLRQDSIIVDDTVIKKSNRQKMNYIITKMDNSLNVQWLKNWESVFLNISVPIVNDKQLTTDLEGNLYIVMPFIDTVMIEGNQIISPKGNYFISKLNNSGDLMWLNRSTSMSGDIGNFIGINGNKLILTAYNSIDNIISFDNFKNIQAPAIVSLDISSGKAVDAFKKFPPSGAYAVGSSAHFGLTELTRTDTFTVKSIKYTQSGQKDLFLVKMDSTITTSIIPSEQNLSEQNLRVYPNPANDYVKVSLLDEFNILMNTISIRDITGRILSIKNVSNSKFTEVSFDVSTLPNGIYFISVQIHNGFTMTQKLNIQR